jgi:benzoyl-CoA reductase/2-hydroxyglutaryl-CoA dehydratase subunit BcrC/BadD/HgdB
MSTSPTSPTARKTIQATELMGRIMREYFYDLNDAAVTGRRKVAWCTSVGPAELLRALGFAVYFPENHGAMLGSTRQSTELIPEANAAGYSPDICSYLTADIGAWLKQRTPLSKAYPGIERVPRPDVLVYNTNQCRDVQDWFGWYARELGVPALGISSPKNVNDVTEGLVEDVARQIEALVAPLEAIVGARLDIDRLRETVALSRRCSEIWRDVLETAMHSPAPLTFFDGTIHMGPAVCLRGTQQALDYYAVLLAELRQRGTDGVGAVQGERLRLYWEGMPVWGRLAPALGDVCRAAHGGGGLDLLQQLDLPGLRWRRPLPQHGAGLPGAVHRARRALQGALSGGHAAALQGRRHHLPRRQDLPLQLEQPLRPAAAPAGEHRRALAGAVGGL